MPRSYVAVGLFTLMGCGSATQTAGPPPTPESPRATEAAKSSASPSPAPSAEPVAVGREPGGDTKPDSPPPGASHTRLMHAHFTNALLIRKAVIAGTPERAGEPAEALAKAENPKDLPAAWRESLERMQQIAGHINDSTNAAQAAAATADLGVACGGCHQSLGGPKASSEPPPPEGTSLSQRMQRHTWATERLWEGLTVPSSDAWNAGAKALSGNPFPDEVLKRGGVHARSAAGDLAKLVVKAPGKKTPAERAALYAELLVTCGGCHRAINEAGAK